MKITKIIIKMPKTCLICKKESDPTSTRSFHKFPRDESMRQKWLDVVNVSKTLNFKTACICSDHFDEESFYSDDWRQKRWLRKEAVPKTKETKETAIIDVNNCELSDITEDISLELCTVEVSSRNSLDFQTSNVLEDVSLQSHLNENIEMCTNDISLIKSMDSQESDVSQDSSLQSSTKKMTETYTQEVPLNNSETLNGSTLSSELNSKKRKCSLNKVRTRTKVRFINHFKTEYVCREDFISEEAWNRFLRYYAHQKSIIATAYNRTARKQKKIKSLTALIGTSKKRERKDFAAAVRMTI
ncbi:uncharacterized protein LOC108627266 [Ceratina calcarata]|uniref:Uncharacterized protein LOC108627266 n=1 Tax=Ceratina calcarata TaxID=156304 RepID=A0AAJ7N991_9HYME|nr:uncharacterized protein LOC108627266 [Ceratina calcarata]